jgi:hypothetical protein
MDSRRAESISAVAMGPPARLSERVKYRIAARNSHEDKQDASRFWRRGPFVGGRGQQRAPRPHAISIVIGGCNRSGRVLASDTVADNKSGDLQGGSLLDRLDISSGIIDGRPVRMWGKRSPPSNAHVVSRRPASSIARPGTSFAIHERAGPDRVHDHGR